ncbi:unnamed protein product [Echinostoma caproni]|uniref:PDZ domain-containing protein n=1 Tax=Echinostoma caproni TaxID=27848 RepID=A0A3P8GUF4_9TREM|nr:unnamed protein product [Echinostoma caproni]
MKILEKYRASATANQMLSDLPNSEVGGALKMLAVAAAMSSSSSTDPTHQSNSQIQKIVVHIHRQPGAGLGLSIAGGVGSVPFQGSDHGIFVSRLNPTGLAYASGLRLHDKLLEVNGTSLVNVEHQVAVSALRAQTNDFRILVARDPSLVGLDEPSPAPVSIPSSTNSALTLNPTPNPFSMASSTADVKLSRSDSGPSHIRCTIQRDSAGLGFSIVGGRGAVSVPDRERITVSKITEGGAASKCGNLFVGDQIIKINGIDVQDARHDQVIALLTGAGTIVDLEVLRPGANSANGFVTPPNPEVVLCAAPSVARQPSSSFTVSDKYAKESWLGHASGYRNSPPAAAVSSASQAIPNNPVYVRHEKGMAVESVTIQLDGGPLGLAIYGGSDINCQPFSSEEPGIFISRISNEGAAQNSGLRVGDRILRVNDVDLRKATHDEAVEALIQPVNELHLEVRRDPTPPGLRVSFSPTNVILDPNRF